MDSLTDNRENYFTFGPILRANLDGMKAMQRTDRDIVIFISSKERLGKSTLAIQIALYMDDNFSVKGKICFTYDQFMMAVTRAKQYDSVIIDEGVLMMLKRRAMSGENVELVKMFSTVGYKNLCFVICVTDPTEVERYMLSHRAGVLLHIEKRGVYKFYSEPRLRRIRRNPETKVTEFPVPPNFNEKYQSLEGKPLFEEYKEWKRNSLSDEGINKVWKAKAKEERRRKGSWTFAQIAKWRDVSGDAVHTWVLMKRYVPRKYIYWDAGKWRVEKKGINILKKRLDNIKLLRFKNLKYQSIVSKR